MDEIRIFVGSDVWQRDFNGELLYSTALDLVGTGPITTTFMRGDPDAPEGSDWKIARDYRPGVWAIGTDPGQVYAKGGGWATPFTMFRWAIPEMCGFEGHAIYTDCDQWWTRDPRTLFDEGRRSGRAIYCAQMKACVMVLDCAAFRKIPWWPTVEEMRQGNAGDMYSIRQQLQANGHINPGMSRAWNYPDNYIPGETGIVHTTNARTQPWHPYRHVFGRPPHKSARVRALYQRLCDAAEIPQGDR